MTKGPGGRPRGEHVGKYTKPFHEAMGRTFKRLCELAAKDEPMPSNKELGCHTTVVRALVLDGAIRNELFSSNRRLVTILIGRHRGKHTKRPEGSPYKVYVGAQVVRLAVPPRPKERQPPSPPGPLRDPELAAAGVRELVQV